MERWLERLKASDSKSDEHVSVPWVQIPPSPPIFTFCEIVRNSLGAKCLGMVFFRNFKGIFEIAKELSQDRLLKLADVSYNSIIKLETGGITNPTIKTLQKIAKALEVSVDDLIK